MAYIEITICQWSCDKERVLLDQLRSQRWESISLNGTDLNLTQVHSVEPTGIESEHAVKIHLLLCFILCVSSQIQAQSAQPKGLTDQQKTSLKDHYASSGTVPFHWQALIETACEDSGNTPVAIMAAHQILDLLVTTCTDMKSLSADSRSKPNLITKRTEYVARKLHTIVGQAAVAHLSGRAAIIVLKWMITNEPDRSLQAAAMRRIGELSSDETEDILVAAIQRPGPNRALLYEALRAAVKRAIPIQADLVTRYSRDIRPWIRKAAHIAAREQDLAIPDYNPEDSLSHVEIQDLLRRLQELVGEQVPANARAICETQNGRLRFLGFKKSNAQGGTTTLEPFAISPTSLFTIASTARETAPKILASHFISLRAQLDAHEVDQSSQEQVLGHFPRYRHIVIRNGRLPPHFRASPAECAVILWLIKNKEPSAAVKLLSVLLEGFSCNEDFVRLVERHISARRSEFMMRDFGQGAMDSAVTNAKYVAEKLPSSANAELARILASELPLRDGDFVNLRLPNAEEWGSVRSETNRAQQISYLCRRLRLIRIDTGAIQDTLDAARSRQLRRTLTDKDRPFEAALNPYLELLGSRSWNRRVSDSEPIALTREDISTLAPFLLENWSLHTSVEVGLGGHQLFPVYAIHQTRVLVASVINEVAGKKIVDHIDFENRDALQRKNLVNALIRRFKD